MTHDLVIRKADPTDAEESDAVRSVIAAAFVEQPSVATLWADVERRGHARGSLVALEAGRVVGHVGLSHSWLDTRRRLVDVLVLSPLSVVPARQGSGIGGRLLAAAIEAAQELAAPAVFLEGDPGFYSRHGFVPGSEHGLLAPSARIPGPAFQVVLLERHEPWMTGRLVYREVWWDHDAVGLRDPGLAEVEQHLGVADPSGA
ncbi:N-acetyltransferase [Nocardioides sp. BGMRC 2183]|nr:N-acetyltransferase [Nocardioides sp. BGMRC 2183]